MTVAHGETLSGEEGSICAEVYSGPTYPDFHGTKCTRPKGHDVGPPHGYARHVAMVNRVPLQWYSDAQKAARRAEKGEAQ